MIKEILFNKQKYFEGQMPSYIGKNIVKLSSQNIQTYYLNTTSGTTDESHIVKGNFFNNKKIQGQLVELNSIYIQVTDGTLPNPNPWLKLSDLIKNGGVLPSLYTKLCSAFRKAVVGC